MRQCCSREMISTMDILGRISLAGEKVEAIVSDLMGIVQTHENNAFLSYSPLLVDQIPKSYAANAFKDLQKNMLEHEVLRLCAFWDSLDLEKYCIATVVELLDNESVIRKIAEENSDSDLKTASSIKYEGLTVPKEVLEASVRRLADRSARETEARTIEGLTRAIKSARDFASSQFLKKAKEFRHKIAHNLPWNQQLQQSNVAQLKYGDEEALLDATISIVDDLAMPFGKSHDWDGSRDISKVYATALWENCSFNIRPKGLTPPS